MEFQVPNTLSKQIANYLAEHIMTGKIAPGERIHEVGIADKLKVSRASVREALYTLERWHLVDITPRRGAAATELDATHAAELYDLYMHLLLMLAKRLIERWQEQDKQNLIAAVQAAVKRLQPTTSVEEAVEASFDVLDACCQLVGNPYLTEALDNFKPAVSRVYYLSADRYRENFAYTGEFLAQLIQAVLGRNQMAAAKLVAAFAEHQKQLVIRALTSRD